MAYVIPRPGAGLTEAELIAHCRGRIASFKVPRHVRMRGRRPADPGPHGDKVQKGSSARCSSASARRAAAISCGSASAPGNSRSAWRYQ